MVCYTRPESGQMTLWTHLGRIAVRCGFQCSPHAWLKEDRLSLFRCEFCDATASGCFAAMEPDQSCDLVWVNDERNRARCQKCGAESANSNWCRGCSRPGEHRWRTTPPEFHGLSADCSTAPVQCAYCSEVCAHKEVTQSESYSDVAGGSSVSMVRMTMTTCATCGQDLDFHVG